jgi:hypothetical protein
VAEFPGFLHARPDGRGYWDIREHGGGGLGSFFGDSTDLVSLGWGSKMGWFVNFCGETSDALKFLGGAAVETLSMGLDEKGDEDVVGLAAEAAETFVQDEVAVLSSRFGRVVPEMT